VIFRLFCYFRSFRILSSSPPTELPPRTKMTTKRLSVLLALLLLMAAGIGTRARAASGDCAEPLPAIFKRVSPAVVFISATSINPYHTTDRVERVIGSGFIIDGEGLVLTNSHLAFGPQSLTVKLDDGTVLQARLIGADPLFDIAVLQIPNRW
jgi:S1-C subfamily serine protease